MWFKTAVEIIVVLAAQTGLTSLADIAGYRPDILLIYIVYRYQKVSGYQLILGGFTLGLLQDLLGGGFIGLAALSKTVSCFILTKIFRKEGPLHNFSYAAGAALCFLTHDFIYNYIYWQTEYLGFFSFLFLRVVPTTFYNLTILILILLVPVKKRRYQ